MKEVIPVFVSTSSLKNQELQLKVTSVIEVILLNEMQQLSNFLFSVLFAFFPGKYSYYIY